MSEGFRPTLWPGEVIPAPRVIPVGDVEVVDEEWVTFVLGLPDEARHLPDEFYLRELDGLDFYTRDIRQIAKLIEEFGLPFQPGYQEWAGDFYAWEQRGMAASMRQQYEGDHPAVRDPMCSVHLSEVQTHFDALRFLREAWIDCAANGSMSGYAASFRLPEAEVRASFFKTLNQGLSLAHARVVDPEAPEELATLYGVSCLQIYNHIAEDAQFKRCANEACRRWFVRQRGRAQQGQHKTEGVRFCSRECARAQAQRELRRRKKYGAERAAEETLKALIRLEKSELDYVTSSDRSQFPDLGRQLREARERAGVSQEAVVKEVGLSSWVEALEAGNFAEIHSGAEHSVRGVISEYSYALGVSPAPFLEQYERDRFADVWEPGELRRSMHRSPSDRLSGQDSEGD